MKIPPQAKRVFQGEIFELYQWEQKMYDGSTKTFEMLKRPDTVQVIPVVEKKIWLADEQQPDYKRGVGMFGGGVREGEDPLATAKRELLEEAGLGSDDWQLFKTYELHYKIDWTIYYYIARDCRKIHEPKLDAGERIAAREISFEEFMETVTSPEFRAGDFTSDMLRLQIAGRLDEFKKKLWG